MTNDDQELAGRCSRALCPLSELLSIVHLHPVETRNCRNMDDDIVILMTACVLSICVRQQLYYIQALSKSWNCPNWLDPNCPGTVQETCGAFRLFGVHCNS